MLHKARTLTKFPRKLNQISRSIKMNQFNNKIQIRIKFNVPFNPGTCDTGRRSDDYNDSAIDQLLPIDCKSTDRFQQNPTICLPQHLDSTFFTRICFSE